MRQDRAKTESISTVLEDKSGIVSREAADRLLVRLRELQYSTNVPVLLFTQDPTGLGGQISRRLLGLKLALRYNRKVVFPSYAEPPYTQVFSPIHSEYDYHREVASAPEFMFDGTDKRPVLKLNFWSLWENEEERNATLNFVPPELEGTPNPELYLDGALLSFCQLIPKFSTLVAAEARRLGVGRATLGVHLRRGDKSVETPYVPAKVLNELISEFAKRGNIDSVFLASDSPRALEEIVVPDGIRLIFDNDEIRHNNANHKFLIQNPEMAESETATAVKNMYLLGACGSVIGQNNAHFATLAAAKTYFDTGIDTSVLVEGDIALRYSKLKQFSHSSKRAIREIAKRLMPWATLRHRGRS